MNTGLILMFVALAVCLLIGVPVAFSIGISCMTLLYVNGGPSMDILLQRMVSGAKSFNMLAMPMFIFAGALMVYGSTPRLIKLANMLLRKFPGGLGATAMAACGFFGAVSGSGVASAAAIGKIIGPSMLEEGYPKGLTAGLIAAGGTDGLHHPAKHRHGGLRPVGQRLRGRYVPRRRGPRPVDHHRPHRPE